MQQNRCQRKLCCAGKALSSSQYTLIFAVSFYFTTFEYGPVQVYVRKCSVASLINAKRSLTFTTKNTQGRTGYEDTSEAREGRGSSQWREMNKNKKSVPRQYT